MTGANNGPSPDRITPLHLIGVGLLGITLAAGPIVPDLLSASLFLAGLIGLADGLWNGFWTRLDRDEKRIAAATFLLGFATVTCFALGRETHIGFQILGRELRILLFLPVYLVVRRLALSQKQLGVILGLAAGIAFAYSLWSLEVHAPGYRVRGVTGVAIVFGDLALLAGVSGAWLLLPKDRHLPFRTKLLWGGLAFASLISGTLAAFASGTRGAWIAILPFLFVGTRAYVRCAGVRHKGRWYSGVALVAAGLTALCVIPPSPIQTRVIRAVRQTWISVRDETLPLLEHSPTRLGCLNRNAELIRLRHYTVTAPPLDQGDLKLVRLPATQVPAGCTGHMAFRAHVLYSTDWLSIWVNTSSRRPGFHEVQVWARGQGLFQIDRKGPVEKIHGRQFRLYSAIGDAGRFAPLTFHLHPGWTLTFIPVTTYPWEFSYDPGGNSIGNRLALWRTAFLTFMRHPWLGAGTGSFESDASQRIRDGQVPPVVWGYQHAHNDFFNLLATEGLLGLVALLWFYYALMRIGGGPEYRGPRELRVFMVLFVLGFSIFGFTETLWIHTFVVNWIVFVSAAALAVSRGEQPVEIHDKLVK